MVTNASNDQQLLESRKRLQERFVHLREELRLALLKSDNEHYIDLAGRVHDIEDESVADLLVDLNLAGIDRQIRELREIDAALLQIATGNYGVCEDCDEPIEQRRLEAYPTAKRCHRCQEIYEKTHIQEGHPTL